LKKKLSAFLGKELNLAALNDIRQTIHAFLAKGQAFYEQTVKALARKYTFELNYNLPASDDAHGA